MNFSLFHQALKGVRMSDAQDSNRLEQSIRPTVWTPEDASRFLTSAIQEAQRPLAEALRQRPITTKGLLLLVGIMTLACAIVITFFSRQLDKTEQAAERAVGARDEALTQKLELLAKTEGLEARLAVAQEVQAAIRTESAELRNDAEEFRRLKEENQRFRRQGAILRNQISGLEMEKQALAKQLEAVKSLLIDEAEDLRIGGGNAQRLDLKSDPVVPPETSTPAPEPPPAPEPTTTPEAPPAPELSEAKPIENAPENRPASEEPKETSAEAKETNESASEISTEIPAETKALERSAPETASHPAGMEVPEDKGNGK
jgi:hypothetical protein